MVKNIAYLPERRVSGKNGRKRNVSAVKSFLPAGRSQFVIYVVALKEHPGVVKIGRTTNWNQRRKSYEGWNLAPGDAVDQARAFVITDEFVDLRALEGAMLDCITFPRRHGREWFVADFDDLCRLVDQFLCEHEISYV